MENRALCGFPWVGPRFPWEVRARAGAGAGGVWGGQVVADSVAHARKGDRRWLEWLQVAALLKNAKDDGAAPVLLDDRFAESFVRAFLRALMLRFNRYSDLGEDHLSLVLLTVLTPPTRASRARTRPFHTKDLPEDAGTFQAASGPMEWSLARAWRGPTRPKPARHP